jgi:hypothetical protein
MYSLYKNEYRIFKTGNHHKSKTKVVRRKTEEMNQFGLQYIFIHGNVTRNLPV